jgi:hypothetical protein
MISAAAHDLNALTLRELKSACRRRGLSDHGCKADIVERLAVLAVPGMVGGEESLIEEAESAAGEEALSAAAEATRFGTWLWLY